MQVVVTHANTVSLSGQSPSASTGIIASSAVAVMIPAHWNLPGPARTIFNELKIVSNFGAALQQGVRELAGYGNAS